MSWIGHSTRVLGGADLAAVRQRWLEDLARRGVLAGVTVPAEAEPRTEPPPPTTTPAPPRTSTTTPGPGSGCASGPAPDHDHGPDPGSGCASGPDRDHDHGPGSGCASGPDRDRDRDPDGFAAVTSRPCAADGPDVHAWARLARDLFAEAREATLLVEGVEHGDDPATFALADDGGRPLLWLPGGSRVSACAVEARRAILKMDPRGADLAQVVLVGRLTFIGVERVDGAAVDVVSLELSAVYLECGQADRGREIPVAVYLHPQPDPEPPSRRQRSATLTAR